MGNEKSAPVKPPRRDRRVLYTFTFKPCVEDGESLDLEVVFSCERGEVGPTPLNQVVGVEERGAQLWLRDMGNPKYCVIVMHRGQKERVPQWSLGLLSVSVSRKTEKSEHLFSHPEGMGGGGAEVYSVTMTPYKTSINKFILYDGEEEEEEVEEREVREDGYKQS